MGRAPWRVASGASCCTVVATASVSGGRAGARSLITFSTAGATGSTAAPTIGSRTRLARRGDVGGRFDQRLRGTGDLLDDGGGGCCNGFDHRLGGCDDGVDDLVDGPGGGGGRVGHRLRDLAEVLDGLAGRGGDRIEGRLDRRCGAPGERRRRVGNGLADGVHRIVPVLLFGAGLVPSRGVACLRPGRGVALRGVVVEAARGRSRVGHEGPRDIARRLPGGAQLVDSVDHVVEWAVALVGVGAARTESSENEHAGEQPEEQQATTKCTGNQRYADVIHPPSSGSFHCSRSSIRFLPCLRFDATTHSPTNPEYSWEERGYCPVRIKDFFHE
ncbi:hypothetical protein [Pseudonocardia nigra]|uniref:hypothetical protein n=1 Tax=Pseudonocardia nigra TaxID=1921578 RepID=UPI001C5E6753|nr:hypothetical protein [Pseudonocardia nigra]